jgi:hypothetical protein
MFCILQILRALKIFLEKIADYDGFLQNSN